MMMNISFHLILFLILKLKLVNVVVKIYEVGLALKSGIQWILSLWSTYAVV